MSDPSAPAPAATNPALSALISSAPPSAGPSTAASSPAPVFNTANYELNAKVTLADLCAKGTSHYAHKQYEDAAEYFARAAELQAEVNGEMSEENGEVLFLYGRSLFRLGQSNSDVLGGNGGNKSAKKAAKPKKEVKDKVEEESVTEAGVAIMAEGVDKAEKEIKEDGEEHVVDAPKKPLFQFTGDENFEDSDDDAEEEAEGEEEEEEDDELGTAFEVLDLARVLFTRKLDTVLSETSIGNDGNGEAAESKDKGKGRSVETKLSGSDTPAEAAEDTPLTRHIKERLADTHDLLAEISLENERFPNAVADFKESLKYKEKLYPFFSEIIAEAHYKLSLALEFASITTTQEAADQAGEGERVEAQIDEAMREEAAVELEKAIASTEGKLKEKELEVAETNIVEENDVTRKQIVEVKEIIADMKQRLKDLRAPPIDLNAALSGPSSGIIGATLGESPAEAAKRIEEAKAGAKDLSSMVRKKEKKVEVAPKPEASNGKRKAEDEGEGEAKKVKTYA